MDDYPMIVSTYESSWRADLSAGLADISMKTPFYNEYWDYYHGRHPRRWLTDQMFKMFDKHLASNMSENWCKLAVNAPLKRLRFTGWQNGDEALIAKLKTIVDDNKFELRQKDLWRDARVTKEGFVFVWPDDTKPGGYELDVVPGCHVSWYPEDARTPDYVVLILRDEAYVKPRWRATVYYDEETVRLLGPEIDPNQTMPLSEKDFNLDPDDPGGAHGMEGLPVVRFTLGDGGGIIKDVKNPQDRLNKLEANKMVASEFSTFRKLAILTRQKLTTAQFKQNQALILDPGESGQGGDSSAPTSIWEGAVTELSNYDSSKDKIIDTIFTLATLPRHMRVDLGIGVGGTGIGIEADEGPFIESIEDMQESCSAGLQDLAAIIFGQDAVKDLVPTWHNPRPRSDLDELTAAKIAIDTGMPPQMAYRIYCGWDDDMIKEYLDLKQEADAKALPQQPAPIPPVGGPTQ